MSTSGMRRLPAVLELTPNNCIHTLRLTSGYEYGNADYGFGGGGGGSSFGGGMDPLSGQGFGTFADSAAGNKSAEKKVNLT